MKIVEKTRIMESKIATKANGAHGPILSKIMPPTSVNMVIPDELKKNITPLRLPLILGSMFRKKRTWMETPYMLLTKQSSVSME